AVLGILAYSRVLLAVDRSTSALWALLVRSDSLEPASEPPQAASDAAETTAQAKERRIIGPKYPTRYDTVQRESPVPNLASYPVGHVTLSTYDGWRRRADGERNSPGLGLVTPSRRYDPRRLVGEVISSRYRIDELIAEGGMGAIYRAEHMLMRKRLA